MVRWHGGMWLFVKLSPRVHGWVMYCTSVYFIRMPLRFHTFFPPQTIIHLSVTYGTAQHSSLQEARELPVQRCPGPCDFLSLMWFWVIFHSWPYLRFSHTSRIPTSAGGLRPELALCLIKKKLRPSRHYSPRKRYTLAKPQMQVIYLLVGNVFFRIVIQF